MRRSTPLSRLQLRQEALILLRGLIVKSEKNPGCWEHLTPAGQARVKTELLASLEGERNEQCRNYLCDIISELGSMVLGQSMTLLSSLLLE